MKLMLLLCIRSLLYVSLVRSVFGDVPLLRDLIDLSGKQCWGYEKNCLFENSYSADRVKCPKSSKWASTKRDQIARFFEQADFGYVKQRMETIKPICRSKGNNGSLLECSDHLRFCRGRNILLDFKSFKAKGSKRYRDDLIHKGEVGGVCDYFDHSLLQERADEKSYLQSWGHELHNFESNEKYAVNDQNCDVIYDRPTIVFKLDASVNMYHHFCDFVNLFASQFINGTFNDDVDIVWWETHSMGYGDGYFGDTWKAFSKHKPHELITLEQKRVCFRNVMFPLLARQRFGLYYNMPLIDGCEGSGLIHAFSRHLLKRLEVPQNGPLLGRIRITILSRSTTHRRINNVDELFAVLHRIPNVDAQIVDYNGKVPFLKQLEISHNSDIFIGMHGSGLTHLLFLPDWANVFEIYNCDDEHCYKDLARLRGVKYWTWSKMDKLGAEYEGKHPTNNTPHKKFTNYSFDKDEFKRIVLLMIEYVRRHPEFVKQQRILRRRAAGAEL